VAVKTAAGAKAYCSWHRPGAGSGFARSLRLRALYGLAALRAYPLLFSVAVRQA
jgi:hypothetical protein